MFFRVAEGDSIYFVFVESVFSLFDHLLLYFDVGLSCIPFGTSFLGEKVFRVFV